MSVLRSDSRTDLPTIETQKNYTIKHKNLLVLSSSSSFSKALTFNNTPSGTVFASFPTVCPFSFIFFTSFASLAYPLKSLAILVGRSLVGLFSAKVLHHTRFCSVGPFLWRYILQNVRTMIPLILRPSENSGFHYYIC